MEFWRHSRPAPPGAWLHARGHSSNSITSNPAPSDITKPSRLRSKGREASCGCSAKPADSARAAAKQPRVTRSIAASVSPHMAISASPLLMSLAASPIACTPAAQTVTGAPSGPLKPYRMETCPAAMLARKDGAVNGDNRRGPRASVVRTASAIAPKPPTPDAMIVAVRSWSATSVGCQPACTRASCAATSANSMKRSIFLAVLGRNDALRIVIRDGITPPVRAPDRLL